MIATLPNELESFIEQEVACGRYASTDEAVGVAVKLLREMSQCSEPTLEDLEEFRACLAEGHDDIARGRVRRINNEEESRAFAEEIKARGRARLENSRANP